jgi:DNA-binding transcriptional LysR family regulator
MQIGDHPVHLRVKHGCSARAIRQRHRLNASHRGQRQGLRRRVALRIRYFLAAPLIVARSDLVLTAPRSLAEALAGLVPLRVLRPPIDVPPFTTCMVWHERGDHDPAQRWLRAQVLAACGAPAGE